MSAFRNAVLMNADMIEFDLQISRDGIPVVFHDEILDRCTNGRGKLSDFMLKELKELDAGNWKSTKFEGEKIPTLEEVLEFAKNKISLNIEIKSYRNILNSGIEKRALELIRKYDLENYVLFSSFDSEVLKRLRNLSDTVPLALLYDRKNHKNRHFYDLIRELNISSINCSQWAARKSWIKELNRHDIPMFIYTVNSKWLMRRFIRNGAKGIFTNKPDILRQQMNVSFGNK